MEAWCSVYAPDILLTLNPPASENDLSNAEMILRSKGIRAALPSILRLFYRFHNGQKEFENTHFSLGLFGGTCFYHSLTIMRFLHLKDVVSVTFSVHQELKDKSQVLDSPYLHEESTGLSGDVSPERAAISLKDCVVFSSSVIQLTKFYCIGPEVRNNEDEIIQNCPVFVNDGSGDLIPCHPTQSAESGHWFVTWLEEYARRLEDGIYKYQPIDMTHDADSKQQDIEVSEQLCLISHYPVRELFDPTSADSKQGNAAEVTSFNKGATCRVTRNVEVVACPAFIPENSCIKRNEFFWSYSIRMRLLQPDDPAYQNCVDPLNSCQLLSRHWKLIDTNAIDREIIVDGDGVVGHFPHLSLAQRRRLDRPFAYQSCSTGNIFPGSFQGHMTFVPGSRLHPTGNRFDVFLEKFFLSIPRYLY